MRDFCKPFVTLRILSNLKSCETLWILWNPSCSSVTKRESCAPLFSSVTYVNLVSFKETIETLLYWPLLDILIKLWNESCESEIFVNLDTYPYTSSWIQHYTIHCAIPILVKVNLSYDPCDTNRSRKSMRHGYMNERNAPCDILSKSEILWVTAIDILLHW